MIYSFDILDGVDDTPPAFTRHITEPRWKLPFFGTRTDRGALSEGLSTETATHFVVKARNMHGLIVPHNENEAPHFILLMEFESDSFKCPTYAIGIERAFIQHEEPLITRLDFSWEAGLAENMSSSTCGSVAFTNYPTTCSGARIPKLDEETGRIVQDVRDGFWVIDTALVYTEGVEVEEDHYRVFESKLCPRTYTLTRWFAYTAMCLQITDGDIFED